MSFDQRKDILYRDVEELIQHGFLTTNADINGCKVSFRSMFLGDSRVFTAQAGMEASVRTWKICALASTIWMVDGMNLLDESNAAFYVRQALDQMPTYAIDKLFHLYTNLYNRLTQAIQRTEAFCYEDYSRTLWRMSNRGDQKRLNAVQHIWTAFNLAEDDKDTWERDWAAARFIASAQNPKGVKKIAQQDEANRKMEDDRRQFVIRKLYQSVTGDDINGEDTNPIKGPRTKEELEEEMAKWLRGERDFHDMVVENYKNDIRKKQQLERQHHDLRMESLYRRDGDDGVEPPEDAVLGSNPVMGLSPEQLREFLQSKGQKTTATIVDLSNSYVYNKYLAQEIPVGGLNDQGEGVILTKEAPSTLQESLQSRRVQWKDET